MGKKNKSQPAKDSQPNAAVSASGLPFLAGNAAVDTTVSSLFEQSVRDLVVKLTIRPVGANFFVSTDLGWSS